MCALIGPILAAGVILASGADIHFTDVTREAGLPSLRYSEGVNFIDLDADGRPDLFLPVVKGRDRLFRNAGGGKFTEVTEARGIVENNGIGAVAGDLNGDGRLDLYVARGAYPSGTSILYLQRPDTGFEDCSESSGAAAPGNHMSGVLGDCDLDGSPELFAVNWGRNSLYRTRRGGERMSGVRLEDVASEVGLAEEGKSWGAVFGDFNDDGWPDLAVARGTKGRGEPPRLYLNDGRGRFLDRTRGTGIDKVTWSMGVVAADFNRDDRLDLYFTGYEGPGRLFLNGGNGGFSDATDGSGIGAERCMGAAAGDLDGDLLTDLVTAGFDGPVRIFKNLGGGSFLEVTGGAGLDAVPKNEGVALADMDGDGDLDLYVANYEGQNRLYRNDGRKGPWAVVRPRVGRSPAVGAVVRLYRSGGLGRPEAFLARQDLQAGHGFCSQGPSELLFSLPAEASYDLSVTFPGGFRAEYRDVKQGVIEVTAP